MTENPISNSIPQQFHNWFIKPILEIQPDNPDKNEIFRNLMNNRLSVDLNKSLEIIKQNLDYLLTPKTKKQLLEYLYNTCPPKDHHYITWFKRLLDMKCNQLILIYQDKDLAKLNDVVIEGGLGPENHVAFKNEADFNDEVWISISLIQLRRKIVS